MTRKEIVLMRETAHGMDLSGANLLDRDPDKLKLVCNGIGPSWMPEALRKFVSTVNPTLEVPAAIHDIRYDDGGSLSDFHNANSELEENGIKAAKYTYGWYNPLRYIVMGQARKFRRLCDEFGKIAWRIK